MKKILFISYTMPPLLYPRSIQVGRMLTYLDNYNITVVTASENKRIDYTLYPEVYNNTDELLKIKNRPNRYTGYIKNKFFSSFYLRPDIYLNWMNKAYNKITKKFDPNHFDLIITFSQPLSTNILGKNLKKYFGCKWIAHNSDPWVDNPYIHFKPYTKTLNTELEKECFDMADKLLFTSSETSELYKKKYPSIKNKIDYINHSFDENLYDRKKVKNKKPIFRYIGNFYGKRSPEPLFEALSKIHRDYRDKFIVEFIGDNGIKAKKIFGRYNMKNVFIKNSVSYRESLDLMVTSDLLLVIDAPADLSIFFPAKLADYIGALVPILGISPEGSTKRILDELGLFCYNISETSSIAEEIKNIINGNYPKKPNENYKKYSVIENIKKLKSIIEQI